MKILAVTGLEIAGLISGALNLVLGWWAALKTKQAKTNSDAAKVLPSVIGGIERLSKSANTGEAAAGKSAKLFIQETATGRRVEPVLNRIVKNITKS